MPRHFSRAELDLLRVLREGFLESEERPGTGLPPYWGAEDELALYDETFARRIAWKWDAVLGELGARARLPAGRSLLDWGCGSGAATRRYLAACPGVERVVLWDHSHLARAFAAERVRAEFPGVAVETELGPEPPDVLLASHVLGELAEEGREPLLAAAAGAGAVIWVEPGSRASARALGAVRARLLATHDVLAPCPHQGACGALSGDAWCHFFARPAPEAFTTGPWGELARELGIDLRSLPYSFLALARRGTRAVPPAPSTRLLGRPRLTRGRAQLTVCRAEGVAGVDFLQRTDKRVFKRLEDVAGEPWIFDATLEDGRITALTPPPE